MVKIILLKIWRLFPAWVQTAASRLIRPLFQVFAAAVIFDAEKRILLVKTTYNRFHPWGLPGGSLEYGETVEESLCREIWEETSLQIEIDRLLIVKTWAPDRVGFYYLCRITGGAFQPSDEVSELGYFHPEDLPDVRTEDIELIKRIYEEVVYELA
ncbi:MAG: NUDIX hydrolase [Chloroflexota bacterium]|nr:NUDIX domain-containing protein [Chloroflexota bacterium]MBI5702512.1 NUDIX domain-containing protein [Chloroflexota bacterium]